MEENKEKDTVLEVEEVEEDKKTVKENKKEEQSTEDLQEKIEELKNKNIMLLAEMENLRKIHKVEKEELVKYFSTKLFQELLTPLDMFKSALKAQNVSDEVKNWLMGFEMIYGNIWSTFENSGISEIKVSIGDEFDYKFHEGIEEKYSDEFEKGKIMEIKKTGYLLNGRLLQPTTVVVSKGKEEIKENKEEDK